MELDSEASGLVTNKALYRGEGGDSCGFAVMSSSVFLSFFGASDDIDDEDYLITSSVSILVICAGFSSSGATYSVSILIS